MKVSSPVGDFPFEPVRLTVGSGHLTLEGQVGAWPARVELEPRDLVSLGRVAGLRFALPAFRRSRGNDRLAPQESPCRLSAGWTGDAR